MRTYVFTNRVYPPVPGATGELLRDLAEALAADGDRVVVVTSGRDEEPEVAAGRREVINGVEVIRVGTAPFTRDSHWRRAVSYLGLYPQLMWQVWKLGPVDAVVSMTDPPLQVAAVTLAACRARKKIHWAQDLYPELAEELGVMPRGGVAAHLLRALSTWALRRQDEVVPVGRCMRKRLLGRGVDALRIETIPNWNTADAAPAGRVEAARERFGWRESFVVLYSGHFGLAHDFGTPAAAARLLAGSGVRLVFAGEGPRLAALRRETADLPHVSFLPPQPKIGLGAFLAAADAHLVTVRAGLGGLVVPSKIYGALASGRPVFYVGPPGSEAALLVEASGRGASIPNGDAAALAEAIRTAARAPSAGASAARSRTVDNALAEWREILA